MNTGDLGPLADLPMPQSDADKLHNCRLALRSALVECAELREHALPVGCVAAWRGNSFPDSLISILPPDCRVKYIAGVWFFVSKPQ